MQFRVLFEFYAILMVTEEERPQKKGPKGKTVDKHSCLWGMYSQKCTVHWKIVYP